jgi:hypothetical protein
VYDEFLSDVPLPGLPDESVALPPIKGVAAERSVLLRLHALLDRAYERLEPF